MSYFENSLSDLLIFISLIFDVELLEMFIYGCQHLIGYIISYYLQIFSLNKQTIFHFIDDFLYCAKAFKFT